MFVYKSIAALTAALLIAGCGGSDDPGSPATPVAKDAGQLVVLSNRADLLSGGDALIEFVPTSGVDVASAKIELNDMAVPVQFLKDGNGRLLSLVSGLKIGVNKLKVSAGDATTSITLTNHGSGQPVIYGPQITPWICDLGSTDAACSRPVSYTFMYKSSDPAKAALLTYDPQNPPGDIATATVEGRSIPFIVRIETGVINRDYYSIAVLFDRSKEWHAWSPQAGWNRKLLYVHGAGYGMGFSPFAGITPARVQNIYALSKGFAVVTTALNDTGHNSNIAVQGESMMLLREHFIESYGEMRYAIGTGGSGGALAQQWVANAFPGIYDGIMVSGSFPDGASSLTEIEDCGLLQRYFTDPTKWSQGMAWTDEQKRAAQGQLGEVCLDWAHGIRALGADVDFGFTQAFDPSHEGTFAYPGISATSFAGCDLPAAYRYKSGSNLTGVRCSAQDYIVGLVGKRAADGFAKRPYSNVGVQYGLSALRSGAITVAQFVDLNSSVGSHTIDFVPQTSRVAADEGVMDPVYRSGYLNSAHNMRDVAIIDVRSPDTAGIHHQFRSWALRARLDNAQGQHKNQVIWFNSTKTMNDALDAMDVWLAAVKADAGSSSRASKIANNRPAALLDLCGTRDGTNLGMTECTGVPDGSPRMAAGGPLSDDVLACQLVPLDRNTYGVAFSEAQWARMAAAFPTGVCDYAKPGQGQQATVAWQSYIKPDGTIVYGGAPLTSPPASVSNKLAASEQ